MIICFMLVLFQLIIRIGRTLAFAFWMISTDCFSIAFDENENRFYLESEDMSKSNILRAKIMSKAELRGVRTRIIVPKIELLCC